MSQRSIDRVIGFGRIIIAALKGDMKAVLANVTEFDDDDGQPQGGGNDQPMYGMAGGYCRPMPPDSRGHCEVIFTREADGATVVSSRDLRTTRLVGPEEGALGIAHYGGGFVELSWDANKVGTQLIMRASRCDSNLDAVEKAHAFLMNPVNGGDASIQIIHLQGNAIVLDDPGHVTITDKTAKNMIDVGPDGITISSNEGGLKLVGASVIGDPDAAKKVVLLDELVDALDQMKLVVTGLTTWAAAINPSTGSGSGYVGPVGATIDPLVALISTTGASSVLKASP